MAFYVVEYRSLYSEPVTICHKAQQENFYAEFEARMLQPGRIQLSIITFDFFLQQVNMFPTRKNNILDLVLTTTPDYVVNLSCVSARSLDLSSDHSLTFFDFLLHIKLTGHDRRTVFDFQRADWYGLQCALNNLNLSPDKSTDIDIDWERWKNLFLAISAEYIPVKTFKRRNTPPWIDNEVRRLLSKKDSCRKKAKKCHVQVCGQNSASFVVRPSHW